MHRKEDFMEEEKTKSSGKQQEESGTGHAGNLAKALLCAYVVTGVFLLILTLLLYKAGLSEQNVNLGVILIYVIGTFSGGFVMGKLTGQRKFLWGMLSGVIYFLLLVLISFGISHEFASESGNIFLTFVLCAGGGMLGGMVA